MDSTQEFFASWLNLEAMLAAEFLKSWGGRVSAFSEKSREESFEAWQQSLRCETPNELANRACETAKVAVKCFRSRGWMKDEP